MQSFLKNIAPSFTQELMADSNELNVPRQVFEAHFSYVKPKKTANPKLLIASEEVADLLGLTRKDIENEDFSKIFSGNEILENTKPYAMCYGGHQFGHWAGQLGDGRAINLTEVLHNNQRWALQLKGAGVTPYSRTADGLAVLRSSVREFLCSEAMHHLGVPTTRALSLIETGDMVLRDILYNGNPAYERGAVVCRVAPSFVRFGNFEIFASRKDLKNLQLLADYCIKYFYQEFENEQDKYVLLFEAIANRTLDLVVEWERVGFVHGVMNTDNMSILGLTIDYGPYGWLDDYNPSWTPNTTDFQNKRYRFENQAQIVLWNLVQLANALYPLVNKQEGFVKILDAYKSNYYQKHTEMMLRKIGIVNPKKEDWNLIADLEENLQLIETDLTIFFRQLIDFELDNDWLKVIEQSLYQPENLTDLKRKQWNDWFLNYANRLKESSISVAERKTLMSNTNPKFVLRNYVSQLVIDACEQEGDYTLLNEVFETLKNPYQDNELTQKWYTKRPDWALNKVGCSALSCSS
jgi:uncharacterized protein YdiU (UPF0061 family)